jgi:Cu/Zn superoxide dismutase
MKLESSKLLLPLLAALAVFTGCRETEQLSPALPAPMAGTAAAAGTGAKAGTGGGAGAAGMMAAPAGSAVATITGFNGGKVTGTATFTKPTPTSTDVKVVVALKDCEAGKSYPVHIHEGTSCADAMAQGEHWGPQRGEGIPNVVCSGTTGMSETTRPATPTNTAWTIGGDAMTNVVGHAFVVHAPDVPMMPPRIACGVIMQK